MADSAVDFDPVRVGILVGTTSAIVIILFVLVAIIVSYCLGKREIKQSEEYVEHRNNFYASKNEDSSTSPTSSRSDDSTDSTTNMADSDRPEDTSVHLGESDLITAGVLPSEKTKKDINDGYARLEDSEDVTSLESMQSSQMTLETAVSASPRDSIQTPPSITFVQKLNIKEMEKSSKPHTRGSNDTLLEEESDEETRSTPDFTNVPSSSTSRHKLRRIHAEIHAQLPNIESV